MAERLANGARAALLVLAALALPMLPGESAHAELMSEAEEPVSAERLPPIASSDAIESVLAAEEFQRYEMQSFWLPKEREQAQPEDEPDLDWLVMLGQILARIAEAALWLALAAAVILLLAYRSRWLPWLRGLRRERTEYEPPETLFGLDLRPESLPNDVAAEALRLWHAGRARESLSLLYRASLAALIGEDALELRASDTEGDVLQLARQRLEPRRSGYLERLTRAWQELAYAHRTPAPSEAEALCADWPQHFRPAAEVQA
jgi:hypothetical protein